MRTSIEFDYSHLRREPLPFPGALYRLGPAQDREDGKGNGVSSAPGPVEREDLPYRVELWDTAKAGVEQVLAVAASASIGFAAFYGATREFPERYITLRHKGGIISRWNEPQH
jgi:hypothetical protein